MKKIVLFALLIVAPCLAFSQELSLNTAGAKVNFEFVSDGVKGTVGGLKMKINLNLSDLASSVISGTADVSTLSTGNGTRDKHLKSADFFNEKEYPTMSFESTSITKTGDSYESKGKLTIAGVTKEVTFKINMTDTELKLTTEINAHDFNVSPKKEEKSQVKIKVSIPLA